MCLPHSTHFIPRTVINIGAERKHYNLLCMREREQDQSVPNDITLRALVRFP